MYAMNLQGNNEKCVKALYQYVTFEQAIWCVHQDQLQPDKQPHKLLHPSLVSKYVELIKGNKHLITFYRSAVHFCQTFSTSYLHISCIGI